MKKGISVILAMSIACSAFALSACGEGKIHNAAVEGKFTAIVAESQPDYASAIEEITEDIEESTKKRQGVMTDLTARDAKFCYRMETGTSLVYHKSGQYKESMFVNGKLNVQETLKAEDTSTEDDNSQDITSAHDAKYRKLSSGNMNLHYKFAHEDSNKPFTDSIRMKAKMYGVNDDAYAEVEASGKWDREPFTDDVKNFAVQTSWDKLSWELDCFVFEPFQGFFTPEKLSAMSVQDVITFMKDLTQRYGNKLFFLYKKNKSITFKVHSTKFAAGDELMDYVRGQEGVSFVDILSNYECETGRIDYYVTINADGFVEYVGMDYAIKSSFRIGYGKTSYAEVKGGRSYTLMPDLSVSVPEDIEEDKKYDEWRDVEDYFYDEGFDLNV